MPGKISFLRQRHSSTASQTQQHGKSDTTARQIRHIRVSLDTENKTSCLCVSFTKGWYVWLSQQVVSASTKFSRGSTNARGQSYVQKQGAQEERLLVPTDCTWRLCRNCYHTEWWPRCSLKHSILLPLWECSFWLPFLRLGLNVLPASVVVRSISTQDGDFIE